MQIKVATDEAAKVATTLSRLTANIGGLTANKRRNLISVTQSILLCSSETRCDVLNQRKYREIVAILAIIERHEGVFRTLSETAVLVVAGVIPVDLLAACLLYTSRCV